MAVLSKARDAMRESNSMARLLTLPAEQRSVVVYAEDTFSYIQLKGYLNALWNEHGIPHQYVTSDPEDPLLSDSPVGADVWFIRDQLARFISRLECDVFVTTMPDLGRFHVPLPKRGRTVYVFHSLNSTHTAYRRGAFDNYDVFLCTGPHHVRELSALRSSDPAIFSKTGYYKLDLIREEFEAFTKSSTPSNDLVLVAPSWGPGNILESVGSEVISSLMRAGLRVIVRPHPQFFHSLYPKGRAVIESLIDEFERESGVEFELTIDSQNSFLSSGLMISDWSGAAFEFALGTRRPALFVDTPQKIFNQDWQSLGISSFERSTREVVGEIVSIDDVTGIGERARKMLAVDSIASRLDELAHQLVFNLGQSSSAGASAIAEAL